MSAFLKFAAPAHAELLIGKDFHTKNTKSCINNHLNLSSLVVQLLLSL